MPGTLSEGGTLRVIRKVLERQPLTPDVAKALDLVERMLDQLGKGIHVNPLMAVFGNPGKRAVCFSEDVMAVLYVHKEDGAAYCHGFGNADIRLQTHRDGSVTIHGLKEQTGVKMLAAGQCVVLEKPGVSLSEDF